MDIESLECKHNKSNAVVKSSYIHIQNNIHQYSIIHQTPFQTAAVEFSFLP